MRILKLLKQVHVRYVRWTLRKLDFSKPQPVACERLLQALEPKAFRSYQSDSLTRLTISLPVPTLQQYNQYLKQLALRLMRREEIPNLLLKESFQLYTVDPVLSKADGYYVNVEKNLDEFKKVVSQLLAAYPKVPADYGLECHYQLRLNQTLLGLVVVINTLLEAQLQQ